MPTAIDTTTNLGWVTRKVLDAHGYSAKWIADFKRKYGKTDTRKMSDVRQSARFYRVAKVNEVIEAGAWI